MTPPADNPSDPPDSEELAAQLDELAATLTDLRGELRDDSRRGPSQPPQLSELLRFTEQYTIPTLIAILEATIRSLELLRRTLRLADPARAARTEKAAARDRLDTVGSEAGRQLADALTELRTALGETDLPENPESRDLITDARELTGEIETRLRDAEQTTSDQWKREQSGRRAADSTADDDESAASNGVMIDVTDDGEDNKADSDGDDTDPESNSPSVDVDAELRSIKSELDEAEQQADDGVQTPVDAADATTDGDPAETDAHNETPDDDPNDDAADEVN